MRKPPNLFFFRHFTKLFVSKQKKFNRYTTDNRHFTLTLGILVIIMMLQAINSKRKSDGNDCTENISNQTFKRLIAIYFIPDDGKYAYCMIECRIDTLDNLRNHPLPLKNSAIVANHLRSTKLRALQTTLTSCFRTTWKWRRMLRSRCITWIE